MGAGKTELVLSNIFMIISKYCINGQDSDIKEFCAVQGENALEDCFSILEKNMERNLLDDPEENLQKLELACACINFLKSFTSRDLLRKLISSPAYRHYLKTCLTLEERFMHEEDEIPIEIERVIIGRDNRNLIPCLFGSEAIFPYSSIGFRILARVADNFYCTYNVSTSTFVHCQEEMADDLSA